MSKSKQTQSAKSSLTAQIFIIFAFAELFLTLHPYIVIGQSTFITRLGSGHLSIKLRHQFLLGLLSYGLIVGGVANLVSGFGFASILYFKTELTSDSGQNKSFLTLICLQRGCLWQAVIH
jgi:hypothetical protein